jgi:predicted MFS family arabinose efflux permease
MGTLAVAIGTVLPVPEPAAVLAALAVVTWGAPLSASAIPAMSLMTDAVEGVGEPLDFASMLLNLAWSLGETIGAPAAAGLSDATSDAVPLLALAVATLVTVVAAGLARRHARDQPGVGVLAASERLTR